MPYKKENLPKCKEPRCSQHVSRPQYSYCREHTDSRRRLRKQEKFKKQLAELSIESQKEVRDLTDPEQIRKLYRKVYYQRNRKKIDAANKANTTPEQRLQYRYKNAYGVGYDAFLLLCKQQDNKCKICKCELIKGHNKARPELDHLHSTGKIRGVLCHMCNVGLGHFLDNITIVKDALLYLQKNK